MGGGGLNTMDNRAAGLEVSKRNGTEKQKIKVKYDPLSIIRDINSLTS